MIENLLPYDGAIVQNTLSGFVIIWKLVWILPLEDFCGKKVGAAKN